MGQTDRGRFRVMVDPWVGSWVCNTNSDKKYSQSKFHRAFWMAWKLQTVPLWLHPDVDLIVWTLTDIHNIKLETVQNMTECDKIKLNQTNFQILYLLLFNFCSLDKTYVFSADICSCKFDECFPRLLNNKNVWHSCRVKSYLLMGYAVCRVSPSFVCTRPKIYIDT